MLLCMCNSLALWNLLRLPSVKSSSMRDMVRQGEMHDVWHCICLPDPQCTLSAGFLRELTAILKRGQEFFVSRRARLCRYLGRNCCSGSSEFAMLFSALATLQNGFLPQRWNLLSDGHVLLRDLGRLSVIWCHQRIDPVMCSSSSTISTHIPRDKINTEKRVGLSLNHMSIGQISRLQNPWGIHTKMTWQSRFKPMKACKRPFKVFAVTSLLRSFICFKQRWEQHGCTWSQKISDESDTWLAKRFWTVQSDSIFQNGDFHNFQSHSCQSEARIKVLVMPLCMIVPHFSKSEEWKSAGETG